MESDPRAYRILCSGEKTIAPINVLGKLARHDPGDFDSLLVSQRDLFSEMVLFFGIGENASSLISVTVLRSFNQLLITKNLII